MTIIEQMLERYNLNSIEDKRNAIKEIVQEIVLAALSKTDFFKYAAFYGGTALRIFYGLNRFSEDLDFTLLTPDNTFTFEKYIPMINHIVSSMGLKFETMQKEKSIDSNIKSAFLKGNTKEHFLLFYPDSPDSRRITHNETIRVKFEIDINPPKDANTELKYHLLPFPYQVKAYDKSSLFADNIHAVITRGWKTIVKGRDIYDFIFYIATDTKVNLKHLESRLIQSSFLAKNAVLTTNLLFEMLCKRFDEINYDEAKKDVIPFIKDIGELELWSATFFKSISKEIKGQEK